MEMANVRTSMWRAAMVLIGAFAFAAGPADAGPARPFVISPTALDFGDVAIGSTAPTQFVTIMNVSGNPIVASGAGGAPPSGRFGGAQNCQGLTLAPGASCTMQFAFSPTAVGVLTDASIGNWNGQSFNIALTGNGVRGLLISPAGLDFGDVPVGTTAPAQVVTITNVANKSVLMSGAGGAPPSGRFGGVQSCQGLTLASGASCTMQFAFSPTTVGPLTDASVGVWNGQAFNISLKGNGFIRSGSDFDTDEKADLTVYRPSTGQWLVLKSSSNYTTSAITTFGLSTDRPVPGDYDGDGILDFAVYRPSNGNWLVLTSSSGFVTTVTTQWGNATDIPLPGDYDGDGKTDRTVFRPSDGTWYILRSSTGTSISVQWGNSADRPVPGDYDGDGKTDVAVFRPSDGNWYIINSHDGSQTTSQWGNSNDVTVPADYDGDGKTDIAVFRPSDGNWYIINSHNGSQTTVQWGNGNDVMVPADYDGDGKADVAVYRPSTGTWFIIQSSTGTQRNIQWGVSTDIPIPEVFLGRWLP